MSRVAATNEPRGSLSFDFLVGDFCDVPEPDQAPSTAIIMILRQTLRQGCRSLRAAPLRCRRLSTEAVNNTTTAPASIEANAPLQNKRQAVQSETRRILSDYFEREAERKRSHGLGTTLSPYYHPSNLLSDPPKPSNVSLELLMASQTHIGHATSLWHPGNQSHIVGIRDGIHIISLEATAAYLRRAARIVRDTCANQGLVLFVGTRKGQSQAVVMAAKLAEGCHLFERWTPGTITNGQQLLQHCEMRVVDSQNDPVPGTEDYLVNRPVLRPDLVVCLNPRENYVLLRECNQNNIPTIGIIDTDTDPEWVTYPIPANDDSIRATRLIAGVLGKAGEEGQQQLKTRMIKETLERETREEAVRKKLSAIDKETEFLETGEESNVYVEEDRPTK